MKKVIVTVLMLFATYCYSQELYTDDRIIKMELQFYDADYIYLLKQNKEAKIELPAMLVVDDVMIFDSIGVRYKGNSSYNIQENKKSFNISLDEFIDGQELWGYETLNLNNGFVDPTFMREKITCDIFSRYIPVMKAGYVHLYINGENYGLYNNVQQLNKDMIREWYEASSGNLYKGDPRGTLSWRGDDPNMYKADYEKKTNEDEDDWSDLVNLIDLINNSSDLETELPEILNVDRALWYFALCNIFVNLDSYIFSSHNYYIYGDPLSGQFDMLPWDLNEAFGVFPPQLNEKETFPPIDQKAGPKNPLLGKIITVPKFMQMYWAHYRTILNESFVWDSIRGQVDSIRPLIDETVKDDPMKLYSYDDFNINVYEDVQASKRRIPGLRSFVEQRREFLLVAPDLTKPEPVILSVECITEKLVTGQQAVFNVTMQSDMTENVTLHYRTMDGRFLEAEMFDDGNNSDGNPEDNIFGVSITIPEGSTGAEIDFYATAVNNESSMKFYPDRAAFEYLSEKITGAPAIHDIVINEFMASNSTTVEDPQGNYPDWIELFNNSDIELQLNGWYLTDDPQEIQKWQFPDIFIDAAGYLLIWADKDEEEEGLHTNFKLSKDGEYIGLYDNQLNLIDSYTYSEQSTDISEGRYPNGTGNFDFMEYATPGSENMLEVGVKEVNGYLSDAFTISPNPATEKTYIQFNLVSTGNIKLIIYDYLGQQVEEIYSGFKDTGQQSIEYDSGRLSPGVYFCTLYAGGYVETVKMMVVR
jgi:hypothetical protein